MWQGDSLFVLANFIRRDFHIRYRNMSLGVAWSVLNPLVMMSVLTFVSTFVFPGRTIQEYAISTLCGLVPFNFFAVTWTTGTSCLSDNANLIKRVPVPREIVPIASVLANAIQLLVQPLLLLLIVLLFGKGVSIYWLLLPVLWVLTVVFLCGLVLLSSAVNVFVRDTRYIVESACTLLFWLVPILYPFESIPLKYRGLYELNPVAAMVMAMRRILMDVAAPPPSIIWKLAIVSGVTMGFGLWAFQKMKRRFYEYL